MHKSLFILTLLLSIVLSCTADDDFEATQRTNCAADTVAVAPDKKNLAETGEYHILVIGNSFSRDAFSYVPALMQNICPNIHVDVDILYRGGVHLNSHWASICDGLKDLTVDYYSTDNGYWTTFYNQSGSELIASCQWDLVVLQEGNIWCREYAKTKPDIDNLTNYIRSVQPSERFAFLFVPAQPNGNTSLGDYTSDEAWALFVQTAQTLMLNGDVDYVIPCGTAIQNARHTQLNMLGNFGQLTYEGTHLQEGIPCLIDAYAATQSLFNIFGIDASIADSDLEVTSAWASTQNIPGAHGRVITGCAEAYRISKECALQAIAHPYELTIIE